MSTEKTRTAQNRTRSDKNGTAPGRSDSSVWAAPIPVVGAALCAGLIALTIAGLMTGVGATAEIADPGAVTRWGLPTARFVHHLAMATAIAGVILAAVAIPARTGPRNRKNAKAGHEHPVFARALQISSVAAVVWTLAAIAVLVLSYSSLAGQPLSTDEGFSAGFLGYVQSIATGQAWMAIVLIAGIFATLVTAVRAAGGLFFIALLGLTAIIPMALVGHSASGDDHTAAVNSLALHLLGVVIWVGGLVVLALLTPEIRRQAKTLSAREQGGPELVGRLLQRYSVLAGLALVTVAASGVINAELRIDTLNQLLTTPYGIMLVLKTAATLGLAGIGWMHRSWVIPRLTGELAGKNVRALTALLWRLILVEVALMSAVIGISAVLGRTSPPVSEDLPPDATPARLLTGYDLPPEPEFGLWFTLWRMDWLWVAIVVFAALWYLRAMIRVRRQGIGWPIARLLSFYLGLLILLWVTSGGPAVYGMVLFSGHMIQHMTLTMVAPVFLVLGSPVTLAMRSLPARTDGSRGAREWILWIVHSPFSKVVTHPAVAAVNFAGSILLFYYTPIFGFALEYHLGHQFMNVHFLLTGYIFALVIVGHDPLPKRPPHAARLIILLVTMIFHAFLAVALSSSDALIQASWFGNIGHDWGFSAIEDQHRGGELMWGLGEIPAMLMAVIVGIQWSRADRRETKRLDREADRTGDAELNEYNEMFARLAEGRGGDPREERR